MIGLNLEVRKLIIEMIICSFIDDESSNQMVKPTSEAQGLKSVTSFSVVDKFFIFATATKLYVHDKITGPVTQITISNPPLKVCKILDNY